MKLSDFKIRTRLFLTFGMLTVLSLFSAVLGLSKLSAIQANLDHVVNSNNVNVELNTTMANSVHIVTRLVRTVMLLDDPSEAREERAKIDLAFAVYQKAWDKLQTFPPNETSKANRAKILAAAEISRPLFTQVLELAASDKAQDAKTLLMKTVRPATQKWQIAIHENIEFQQESSRKQSDLAKVDYELARVSLLVTAALSVCLAGLLAWAVSRSIIEPLTRAGNAAERVAKGDLTVDFRSAGKDEIAHLLASLGDMTVNLTRIVSEVRSESEGVATASAEISQGNQDLSARTENQASALEETAASMEELGATVRQNADNAKLANQLAQSASTVAVKGGDVVAQVVTTMKGINDSSKRISDIISVIDSIAFQTNILALNAAVEAARAGEQGRGFAVVASEVRSLASRSAEAAKEIKTLINASVARVEEGTLLVDQAGVTMSEVVSSIRRVTDIMGEISAASTEQAQGVAQVGEAVTQMDQVTQQNAALVEEMAAAASSLQSQASALVGTVAVFKLR